MPFFNHSLPDPFSDQVDLPNFSPKKLVSSFSWSNNLKIENSFNKSSEDTSPFLSQGFKRSCSIESLSSTPVPSKRKIQFDINDDFPGLLSSPQTSLKHLWSPTTNISSFPISKSDLPPIGVCSRKPLEDQKPSRFNRMLLKQRTISGSLTLDNCILDSNLCSKNNDGSPPNHRMIKRTKSQTSVSPLSMWNSPLSPRAGLDPVSTIEIPSYSTSCDPIRRINRDVMAEILSGKYNSLYNNLIVVDCRFPYEYQGGHIQDATNTPTIESLELTFFENPTVDKKTLVIFHCEYSVKRAPSMANHLRKRDRELNMANYPNLHYPNVYVLEGGYSSFFFEHRRFCNPCEYISMNDNNHADDCRKHFNSFEKQFKRSKSAVCRSAFDTMGSPTNSLNKLSRSKSTKFPSESQPFSSNLL
ncbi:hypothetical protein BB559_004552 [Furculomyces boomerangus]|uniref:M-phase inducer phosphatase n=2 Tax=Harpellales TaxID=61421 RepID=A0A2T9YE75_9FUNG|nr:hypothetical protein BB559_004552 [Furculomyces boomerangus]PWA01406.1 hypothetical protein BB558_002490 [Smittium angustum]